MKRGGIGNENSQQQAVTSALLNCVTFLCKQGIGELINGTEHDARRGGARGRVEERGGRLEWR